MELFDISRDLMKETAVWPGDSPFELKPILERAKGASVNVARLNFSSHTGSHVDAPRHFTDDGASIDMVDLGVYWGTAQIVTIPNKAGPLYPDDFAGYDLRRASRLLVHSSASHFDPTIFPTRFVFPSPELADYLGELGIVLYGTDAPSMDAFDDARLPGHLALLKNKIAILEGLNLAAVPDGVYELAALPLKIVGGDGSPVRAVLRPTGTETQPWPNRSGSGGQG